MRYLVIVEKGPSSFGAYVPDLPGCIAAGESKDEVLALIHEAIEFHIEGLKEDGLPVPPPASYSKLVEIAFLPCCHTICKSTSNPAINNSMITAT